MEPKIFWSVGRRKGSGLNLDWGTREHASYPNPDCLQRERLSLDLDPDGCLVQQSPEEGADIVPVEISALAKITFSEYSFAEWEKNQKLVPRKLFFS